MIKKIISGGQSGADLAGLKAAIKLGIETGGFIPKNYRTENGSDYTLKKYNLIETKSPNYPPRTKLNISQSDGTMIFGDITGGSKLTLQLCHMFRKPVAPVNYIFVDNLDPVLFVDLRSWIERNSIQVLNIAGNRESKNIGIQNRVENFILRLLKNNV